MLLRVHRHKNLCSTLLTEIIGDDDDDDDSDDSPQRKASTPSRKSSTPSRKTGAPSGTSRKSSGHSQRQSPNDDTAAARKTPDLSHGRNRQARNSPAPTSSPAAGPSNVRNASSSRSRSTRNRSSQRGHSAAVDPDPGLLSDLTRHAGALRSSSQDPSHQLGGLTSHGIQAVQAAGSITPAAHQAGPSTASRPVPPPPADNRPATNPGDRSRSKSASKKASPEKSSKPATATGSKTKAKGQAAPQPPTRRPRRTRAQIASARAPPPADAPARNTRGALRGRAQETRGQRHGYDALEDVERRARLRNKVIRIRKKNVKEMEKRMGGGSG